MLSLTPSSTTLVPVGRLNQLKRRARARRRRQLKPYHRLITPRIRKRKRRKRLLLPPRKTRRRKSQLTQPKLPGLHFKSVWPTRQVVNRILQQIAVLSRRLKEQIKIRLVKRRLRSTAPLLFIETLKCSGLSRLRRVFDRHFLFCLLYTSPSPRDRQKSRMPSSA